MRARLTLTVSVSRSLVAPTLAACALLGCDDPREEPPEPVGTGPNVQIAPAPLYTGKSLMTKSQPAPTGTRGTPLAPTARPLVSEPFSLRAAPSADGESERVEGGLILEAEFSWPGRARRPVLYGVEAEALGRILSGLQRRVTVDLTTFDRMRLQLETDAFPLPLGTAFLAHQGRTGHLLSWPDQRTYRALPAGSVRALFRERRADVTPTLEAVSKPRPSGSRFELATHAVELTTAHGRVELEQAAVDGLGFGGGLLCRFLLEFVAATPTDDVCRDGALPVRAHFSFEPPGELLFAVTALERKAETPFEPVLVPPSGARFVTSGLPAIPAAILDAPARTALRRGPPDGETAALEVKTRGPFAGYLLLEDTPLSFLPARASRRWRGFRSGEYALSVVSFLGEVVHGVQAVSIPAKLELGPPVEELDAGAP